MDLEALSTFFSLDPDGPPPAPSESSLCSAESRELSLTMVTSLRSSPSFGWSVNTQPLPSPSFRYVCFPEGDFTTSETVNMSPDLKITPFFFLPEVVGSDRTWNLNPWLMAYTLSAVAILSMLMPDCDIPLSHFCFSLSLIMLSICFTSASAPSPSPSFFSAMTFSTSSLVNISLAFDKMADNVGSLASLSLCCWSVAVTKLVHFLSSSDESPFPSLISSRIFLALSMISIDFS
mmetsp:Transcript_15572/g.27941  ORF Transcript_15572/g.27941 Transcript_15572/m.27941 type:complete len:234 (+) Transcript_15572:789-1490(+)